MEVKDIATRSKEEFKQTEVGVIPKDWKVVELKQLAEKIMVGIASSATHAYRERGVVLFRNQNIKPNYLDDSDLIYITPEYEQLFKNKRLYDGDLLTARTGYPGTTCKVPSTYIGAQSFTTLITRLKANNIDVDFLCFYINSETGQLFFEQNQIGGGQKNVNAGTLKIMPVPLPPTKAEQTAIATVLSDTDALISRLETLIEKKRAIKQGAMQQLLKPKEGWVVKKLGEVAEIDPDNLPSSTKLEYTFQYISLEDIDCGILNGTIEFQFRNAPSRARRKIQKGDVLISTVRPNLKSHFYVQGDVKDFVCSTGFCVLRCHKEVANGRFVYNHFFASAINNQIDELVTGSNYPAINSRDVRNLEIAFPSFVEQTRIAQILSDMDAEIAGLEQKLAKYKLVKQGMMQELLTGKTRLV